ncbi:MAG: exo-alpha-sialidase [Deltaproteobacteria bacterium]|nr:exo-alpha-sialidase [Deltaproteobacteria bacterium]
MRILRLALSICCLWVMHFSPSFAQNAETLTFSSDMRIEVTTGWVGRQITRDAFLVEHKNASNAVDASMTIRVSGRLSHAQALQRLVLIRSQYPEATTFTLIGGWPGLERTIEVPFQRPGESENDTTRNKPETSIQVLTAVAVKDSLVRFDTLLQPGAAPERGDEALAMARTLSAPPADKSTSQEEMRKLKGSAIAPTISPPRAYAKISTPPVQGPRSAKPLNTGGRAGGAAAEEVAGAGEIDAAASIDGQYFVTAAACGVSYSSDGGATFNASNINGGPTSPSTVDGDCGVAWGPSGTFYLSILGSHPVEFVALYTSADHGADFSYVTNAVDRSAQGINVDQPHVAVDHWNLSASNQDQVYVVWQETNNFVSALACSTNGGSKWSALASPSSGNYGYPRVAVGMDGMVYVVSRSWPNNVDIDKFSSCASGLVEQPGFPFSGPFGDAYGQLCTGGPIPGLDRCNDGNTLASPVIAVDDTDPNHIYMAVASMNASQTGQDILVQDSWDGGLGWGPVVAVNGSATAVRFLSWLGTWGGTAYLGWYDRRFAGNTAADPNDFTRYYMGSVTSANGALTPGPETDLMGIDDPQCAGANTNSAGQISNWANGTRESQDATSCTVQPQYAGFCSTTNATCDFTLGCPSGQTCNSSPYGGVPKYGDYNTLATGGGRLLNIWASGTAPANLSPTGNNLINAYVVVTDLPSDFFVRDWTTNASSHDNGEEPSTNPAFYVTSDVWNQTSSTVEPLVNDWVQGDAPIAGGPNCPPTCAVNYAFARIARRAPAAPTVSPVTVTADFLMADFGLGLPFVDLGSQTVTFAATDNDLFTPGFQWSVPATASSHVCLAVQISAPGDAYLPPSLLGGSPGAAGTDPLVLQDNKKAQRNLQVVSGTGGEGGEFYAIIHNNEKNIPDIEIQEFVNPESAKFVSGSQVTIVNPARGDFAKGGRIFLKGVRPGEDRWLRLSFGTVSVPEGKSATYQFQEVAQNKVVNGFAIELKREPPASIVRSGLRREADVLSRFAAIANDSAIKKAAQESESFSTGTGAVDLNQYRTLLLNQARLLLGGFIRHTDARPAQDPFGLVAGLWAMDVSARSKDEGVMSTAAGALMERLDAYLTWKRRAMTPQATR